MTLFGVLWATLAPLVLLAAVLMLWRGLRPACGAASMLVAPLVVLGPVGVVWWLDKGEFDALCASRVAATIWSSAKADGIFLDSTTANSFGRRYLHQEGFHWFEAPSIYKRGGLTRYTKREDRSITQQEFDGPITADYVVTERHERPSPHTSMSTTEVVRRSTGEKLSEAASATFDGGRMKWVLGAYGTSSCPSARTDPEAFNRYYHLARDTLRQP